MTFITIATVEKVIDAHMFKSRLESEGLLVFLKDEHMVGMILYYNLLLGGIKVRVPENQAGKAMEILTEIEKSPFLTEQDDVLKCPDCGSQNLMEKFKTYGGWRGFLSVLSMLLFTAYPFYYKEKYRCNDCGHLFENKADTNQ